jgi:hypothetical protein
VLLDADTRAEFINRAFRDYFALSDEQADSRLPFIAKMYHGRDTGAFELPEDELSAFVARPNDRRRRVPRLIFFLTPVVMAGADAPAFEAFPSDNIESENVR